MYRLAKLLLSLVLLAAISGCPDQGDSGPADVQGLWTGTLELQPPSNIGGQSTTTQVYGAIQEHGYGFIYDSNGNFIKLPPLSNVQTIDGDGLETYGCFDGINTCTQYYYQNNDTYNNVIHVIGSAYHDFIIASFSRPLQPICIGPCFGSSFQPNSGFKLRPYVPYAGTPSLITGQWQGEYLNFGLSVDIVVDDDGAFSGSDAFGCRMTGSIKQIQTGKNLFSVSVKGSYSFDAMSCSGTLTGLGYLSSTGSGQFKGVDGVYMILGYSDSSLNAYVAEFKVQ